jgi:ABC-2 type transport system ATP-binding protein
MGEIAGISLSNDQAIRQRVGLVVTDERSFYWRLSGRRNLQFFASLYGLTGDRATQRINKVLEDVEMSQHADRWFSGYSTGMKQRIAIARALLHRPEILFLDEPSRSLDPIATQNLHNLVKNMVDQHQVTIFLITHDLAEAESICHEVAVMHNGRIQAVGQPSNLRRQLQTQRKYTLHLSQQANIATTNTLIANSQWDTAPNGYPMLTFHASETDDTLTRVLDSIRQQNITILSIEGQPPTLEDVFDYYTNHDKRNM